MQSFKLVVLLIVIKIAMPGEARNMPMEKDLPGAGPKKIEYTATTADSIIGSSDKREKRGCCGGGDGGFGSVKFAKSPKPTIQRKKRSCCGGDDGGFGSVKFAISPEPTIQSYPPPELELIIGGDESFRANKDGKMYKSRKISSLDVMLRSKSKIRSNDKSASVMEPINP